MAYKSQYTREFRLRVVEAAHRAKLVHGKPYSSVYNAFGISSRLLHKWLRRAPGWIKAGEDAKKRALNEKRRPHRKHGMRYSEDYRRAMARKARVLIRQGYSLDAAAKRLQLNKSTLAQWLWEAPLWALVKQALEPSGENIRRPPRVERPRAPRYNPLTWKMLEEPPAPNTGAWLASLRDSDTQQRAKAAYARLAGRGQYSEGQRQLLAQAGQLDAIADRVLERIDRLMTLEVAGARGAEAALYDWEWFYVNITREMRALLTAAGVAQEETAPRIADKLAGAVVIPDEL